MPDKGNRFQKGDPNNKGFRGINAPRHVIEHKAGVVKDHLDWNPWTVREILLACGAWDKLVEAGYMAAAEPESTSGKAKRDRLLTNLYNRAMNGDPQAAKQWMEWTAPDTVKNAFDIQVNVTPYRIKDASLSQIVMESDEVPLSEIMVAFVKRMRVDGFPDKIIGQAEDLLRAWYPVAKNKYRNIVDAIKLIETPISEEVVTEDALDSTLETMLSENAGAPRS